MNTVYNQSELTFNEITLLLEEDLKAVYGLKAQYTALLRNVNSRPITRILNAEIFQNETETLQEVYSALEIADIVIGELITRVSIAQRFEEQSPKEHR